MTMRPARYRAPAIVALAGVLGLSVGGPAAADQAYYWKWSDGSTSLTRTFTQSEYGTPSRLPRLVAWAEPASPRRLVHLQFRRRGTWITENTVRMDGRGIATIEIDPMCANDTWCDRTFAYRLTIGDRTARLAITYARE